jgi:hypothetical protein
MDYFAQIEREAWGQRWRLVGAIQTHPGGDGYVPHGVALIKRKRSPLGEGMEYGTVGWYVQANYAGFEQGNYDLTYKDGLADLFERANRPVAAGGPV